MRTHSLKPFDDGKYLSEEEAMKLLESIPIPEDDHGKKEAEKSPSPKPFFPLEIISGNFLEAVQAAVPETIQTAAELQKARVELNNASLYNTIFGTANVPLYGVENGKPFFLFGGREAFLRLYVPNIEEVCRQISSSEKVYTLPDTDKAWAMKEGISSSALKRFDLAELIETKYDDKYGYFTIYTKNAALLGGAKRELAELIHGQGNDYFNTFKMLAECAISKTRVFLLNSDYVNSIARNNLVGRASKLYSFNLETCFEAVNPHVNERSALCAVRQIVVPGGAP